MPWAGTKVWPFTKDGILVNTPNASGVYALWTGETLVYVGESNDILRRLLELFGSPRPCIAKYSRLVFGYELVPTEAQRVERQGRLIRELLPACNQPFGFTPAMPVKSKRINAPRVASSIDLAYRIGRSASSTATRARAWSTHPGCAGPCSTGPTRSRRCARNSPPWNAANGAHGRRGVMDREEFVDEIAGCSAEEFASFQGDVLARRTEILLKRLEALSTADLRARAQDLLVRVSDGIDEQRALATRNMDHVEWLKKLADETDDADVVFAQDLGKDTERAANIVVANSAEMNAIFTILDQRGANLRGEKGGA